MEGHDYGGGMPGPISLWWERAFPQVGYEKGPPGEKKMLILVAYDVTSPRRLAKVAGICEDYGSRVQYSIFECHLEEERFEEMWSLLIAEIDQDEDRLVAYRLDAKSAGKTLTAGLMVCSEKVACYLV